LMTERIIYVHQRAPTGESCGQVLSFGSLNRNFGVTSEEVWQRWHELVQREGRHAVHAKPAPRPLTCPRYLRLGVIDGGKNVALRSSTGCARCRSALSRMPGDTQRPRYPLLPKSKTIPTARGGAPSFRTRTGLCRHRTGLCPGPGSPPGKSLARPETGAPILAKTADFGRQRPRSPASPPAKPRKVKDYSDGARKPKLRRSAWWRMQL
jgi:hypothetical protein